MTTNDEAFGSDGEESANFAESWQSLRNQFYRYWELLKRRWWIPLLTTSVALGMAGWYAAHLPPSFLSTARMIVGGKIKLPENASLTEEGGDFLGTQMELMRSGEVASLAQSKVQALYPDSPVVPVEFSVEKQSATAIFSLRAISTDGVYTKRFLEALIEAYRTKRQKMRSETSETTVSAMTAEIMSLDKEGAAKREELITFQQDNNLGYLKEGGNVAATHLAELDAENARLTAEFNLLGQLNLDQILDHQPGLAAGQGNVGAMSMASQLGSDSDYLRARQQLQELKAKWEQRARVMRPAHPDMISLQQELDLTERRIEMFREQSVDRLKSKRDAIAIQLRNNETEKEKWAKSALEMGRKLAQHDKIRGDLERIEAMSNRLQEGMKKLDVTQSLEQEPISVLERPSDPISVRPGVLKAFLISLGGGAVLGFAILLVMERVDDRIASFGDVQRHFREEIVGQIAHEACDGKLAVLQPNDPRHAFAESFRSIRSYLHFLAPEKRPKTILVTSAIPGEGKSTVTMNMAIATAMAGTKTLLIDCDLRRGAIHRAFGLPNSSGMSEVLKGELSWTEAVQSTPIENLSLLSRGHSIDHPGERLLSPVTDRFIREASAEYECVIFDTAPVLVADDTTSLAPKIDACVVVVRYAHSSARFTERILELLKSRRTRILGLVLNDATSSMPGYNQYYYGYSYYGKQETEEAGSSH